MNLIIAPRPGYASVVYRYRLGMITRKGWRGAVQVGNLSFYRQRRRRGCLLRKAGALRWQYIRPGLWYDQVADVFYFRRYR